MKHKLKEELTKTKNKLSEKLQLNDCLTEKIYIIIITILISYN
jgi:hypothetical protein